MKTVQQERGWRGEELVAEYLQRQGFQVCERNYRCRSGEVDIIARKQELYVFVEVKMRTNRYFQLSLVVNAAKQRKIISAALRYVAERRISQKIFRFDVALVEKNTQGNLEVQYIAHAFTKPELL